MNPFTRTTLESWKATVPHHVFVNERALIDVARRNALSELTIPKWKDAYVYAEDFFAFVSQEFWRSCINFSFAHPVGDEYHATFAARYDNAIRRGSSAMGLCMLREFGNRIVYAEDILNMTRSLGNMKRVFKGFNSMPLMSERVELLEEAATVVREQYDSDPMNIVEAAKYRAFGIRGERGIVEILISAFPNTFGSDVFRLVDENAETREFHFMKRAQLFAKIYHERALRDGYESLKDPHELGPIPDYQIPRGYLADGIFEYSDMLTDKIMNRVPLRHGSRAEIEVRAAVVHAQYEELREMNRVRTSVGKEILTMCELDHYRWLLGKTNIRVPHHLCLNTAY